MANYLTIVAVGDYNSNKTELLMRYTGNIRSRKYEDFLIPKYENNVQNIIVDRISYTVHFVDSECDDDYKILRRCSYQNADCILLCYSVNDKETFANLQRKWCVEVRKYTMPFTPIILVGTGSESRHNQDPETIVSTEQGENFKLLTGAYAFIECSIRNFVGIDDIFIEAVRSTTTRQYK